MKLTIEDGRDHFYTFDTNRILLLTATDEENIRQVEFSTEENGEEVSWTSDVLTGEDGIKFVQVPNEFLNGNYSRLVCYYVALDSKGEYTRQKEIFRIRVRQQPEDYFLTYSERVTFASIKALTEQYKTNASESADLARRYAEESEDVNVEAGTYSSKHWSIKAEAAKETAVQKATEAGTSEVNSKTYMESAQSAKQYAETAKNAANTILEQVQSKGTEITNFVATSKTEIDTQKNESVNAVKSVYQTDLNELKGDLDNLDNALRYPKSSKTGYINVFNDCKSSDIFNVSGGEFCVTGENLLDVSTKVSNKIKNDSGEEVSDGGSSYYSRKIPVVSGMTLTSNFPIQRLYLFDSNGTFIKRTELIDTYQYTIPSDVYFVQVQISNDFETESMMLNFGNTVLDYSAFKINTDGFAYEGTNIVGFREQATNLSVTLVKKISSVDLILTDSNEKIPTSKAVLDKIESINGESKTVTVSGNVIVIDRETSKRITEITLPNNSYTVGKNIFDQTTRVIDKIKDNSGVEVYDSQSNYFSIYIPVNGMSFKANFDIQRCYLYDENKTFLRRYNNFIYSGTEFSFSNEVYFIQIQMLTSDITNTLCIVYGDNDTTYSKYKIIQNSVPYGEEFSVFIDGVQDCELSMSILGLKSFIPKVSSYDIWEPSTTTDDYSCTPLGQDSQSIPLLTNTLKYQGFLETYFDIYLGDYSDGYSVKREDLGLDSGATATGNYASPIYSYEFKPKYYNKTVLLSAGMNTCEASTYFGLAYFIKALMEHTESGMLALYNSTRFIVIPVICPSGIAHNPLLYPNSNNVRINKNFEYYGSWERLKDYNGGAYPDSEVETKVLKKWLNKYADSAFWLDCHSDTDVRSSMLHLGTVFCSDSATANLFDASRQKIIDFYKNKGYYSSSDSPILGFSAQVKTTAEYPKTVYAKEVTRTPSAMMEQFEYSTAWGSDGNTNNDSYAIKHYVAMIRYMVLEMCKDSDKFIY